VSGNQIVEEWRQVDVAPEYEVSNLGRVLSRKRGAPYILHPAVSSSGHLGVRLFVKDQERAISKSVHALVANAFIGPRPTGMEVCHRDGNPANNELANLRYGTRSENVLDQVRHGVHAQAGKTHCIHGHEYTPGNTYVPPSGGERLCRACRRESDKRHRAQRATAARRRYQARRDLTLEAASGGVRS
jgi:hypothetical protein